MDHIEKYGIYFLALILLAYHFRFPCNMRLYFGLVAFSACVIVCNKEKYALNDALLVGMVVAVSSDIYKKYLKSSLEGFKEGEDDYEDTEKMKNHKKSKKKHVDELEFDEYVNIEQTLRENVKNIDTETLETMTKQTEKFMNQQEKLLNVVEKLGPTLKNGIKLLNTFNGYKNALK
jgi:hypothetical protein